MATKAMLLILAVGVGGMNEARANASPARDFEMGVRLLDLGEVRPAMTRFRRGYLRSGRPAFLIKIADCHSAMGNFRRAAELYQRYLFLAPFSNERAEVVESIAFLRDIVEGVSLDIRPLLAMR